MTSNLGAPISTVLLLNPEVSEGQIASALTDWLADSYEVSLESAEYDGLMVEWRRTEDTSLSCQLIVSDSSSEARRTVTVFSDDDGAIAIIEESPFASADVPHTVIDLSEPIRLILGKLLPFAQTVLDHPRTELLTLDGVDPSTILEALAQDLTPGLLIAVVADGTKPSPSQEELLRSLVGLATISTISVGAELLKITELSSDARTGSIVSISRTPDGLDSRTVPSTSLRTKPDSARRLIARRQLAAPVPFDLERRRSLATARLLTGGDEIDLPAAMQLWEDETERAAELEQRVKELATLLEQAYEEQDTALGQLDSTQSQLRYVQKAFRELGEVPLVEVEDDEDWNPDSTAGALLAARETLPFLVIGASDDQCNVLDAHQKRGIWAKKIWNALRALNDYCRAKTEGRFSGDISNYRSDTPDGAIALLAEYAPTESKSTTDDSNLVSVRTFKVPADVDSTGRAYMQQHVKIDKGGQAAPRIHLYDDSSGPTQRIHIGYVGPHLPTSSGF